MARAYDKRPVEQTLLIRRAVQVAFLLLNLWIGVRFYFWVRFYETAGTTIYVPRPPGVEGWLPVAALMNLKYLLLTASVPEVHPAGVFLLLAFVAMSIVFRKAFCSWLCPIGTISEWLWQGGREMFGRNLALPRWADLPLRSLKYILLGLFAYAVISMPVPELRAFLSSPYGLVAEALRMGNAAISALANCSRRPPSRAAAARSMGCEESVPATRHPSFASGTALRPAPQPMSSRRAGRPPSRAAA